MVRIEAAYLVADAEANAALLDVPLAPVQAAWRRSHRAHCRYLAAVDAMT
jgi:hypothetical protein